MALYLACCPTLNRKKHTCLRNYLLTKLLHIHTYYTYTYLNDVQPLCKICNLFFLDPPPTPEYNKESIHERFHRQSFEHVNLGHASISLKKKCS